jgi:hypothetical protein
MAGGRELPSRKTCVCEQPQPIVIELAFEYVHLLGQDRIDVLVVPDTEPNEHDGDEMGVAKALPISIDRAPHPLVDGQKERAKNPAVPAIEGMTELFDDGEAQVITVAKMVLDGAAGQSSPLGEIDDRDLPIAKLTDTFDSGRQQLGPRLGASLVLGPANGPASCSGLM